VDQTNKKQEFVPESSNRAKPSSDYFNSCFHFTETVGAVHPDMSCYSFLDFSNLDVLSFGKADFCGDDL
jgi:hypothetical protein